MQNQNSDKDLEEMLKDLGEQTNQETPKEEKKQKRNDRPSPSYSKPSNNPSGNNLPLKLVISALGIMGFFYLISNIGDKSSNSRSNQSSKVVRREKPMNALEECTKANELFNSGDYSGAAYKYGNALKLDPTLSDAKEMLDKASIISPYKNEFDNIKRETNVHLWQDATLTRKEATILLDNYEISNKVDSLLNKMAIDKNQEILEPLREEILNYEYFNITIEAKVNTGGFVVNVLRLGQEGWKWDKTITEIYKYNPAKRQKRVLSGYQRYIGQAPLWINGQSIPNLQDFFESKKPRY